MSACVEYNRRLDIQNQQLDIAIEQTEQFEYKDQQSSEKVQGFWGLK